MEEITQKFIDRYIYCKDSGKLYYKISVGSRKVGDRVGGLCLGYLTTKVDGKHFFVHRIIWAMEYGYIPERLDHINGDKTDNRLENLRECSHGQNMANRSKKSGKKFPKGVYKHRDKYMAKIGSNGVEHYLGIFEDVKGASDAYDEASIRLHKDYAKPNNVTSL
jgi:hypothetical protein